MWEKTHGNYPFPCVWHPHEPHSVHPFGEMISSLSSVLPNSTSGRLEWGGSSPDLPQLLSGHGKAGQEQDALPPLHSTFSLKKGWESEQHPAPC